MKSSITTLAITVFALLAPLKLGFTQDSPAESPTVVAAQPFAPVVRAQPKAVVQPAMPYATPATSGDAPVNPTVAGLVRYAIAPPQGPGDVALTGHTMGLAGPTGKSGKSGMNCLCPQCRRERQFTGSWGSVDYLHVWMKGRSIPALATTSPAGTPLPLAGVLPTTVLWGNGRIGDGQQAGGRIDFGLWMDDQETTGVGVRFFGLEGDRSRFNAVSTGLPILAVPFFNLDLGIEDAVEVAFPGEYQGSIQHRTANNLLMGEAYGRVTINQGCGFRIDMIGGYHMARMNDSLDISSQTQVIGLAANLPLGTTIDVYDSFRATNEMHGGELGVVYERTQGCWSLKSGVKITVANTHQTVAISGQRTINQGLGPVVVPNAGTFAQASNIGVYERDKLTYIPEVNLALGYHVNECLKLTAGYTFLYFPHVVLAGDHVDRVISPSQAAPRPAFSWRETDQWVQGITVGAEWNF